MKKLYIALFIVMIAALSVFAFADGEEYTRIMSYSVDGYAGDETRLFSPDDTPGRGFYKFDLPEEAWSVTGEAENVRRRKYDDIVMGCVYMKDSYGGGEGMTLTMNLRSAMVNIEEYSSMGFGIGVIGGYDGNPAYTVEIELVTTVDIYRSSLRIGQDDELCYWSIIYTDLTEAHGYAEELSVTVRFDEGTVPTQIRVSSPFLSIRTYPGFEMAEKFLTASMKNDAGRFVGATGSVIPAEGDIANIRGSIVTDKSIAKDSTVYFRIELDGLYSGRMTLGINYTDPQKHASFRSEKLTVDGKNVFVIPVELEGEAFEYSLSFEGIECERTFKILSVELYSEGQSAFDADTSVGALNEITRNGNRVKFSGTIDRAAAKKYSGAYIVFYALRDELVGNFEQAVEIGRIKVSTRFEYTADLTSYPASADTYMFMAAIVSGSEAIPLSAPKYCDATEPADMTVSNIGLANAAAAGAFESNISHIIVDVPLSELLNASKDEESLPLNYTVYGGETKNGEVGEIMLSGSVVEELDRDINFYISVGIKVYLRFTAETPIEGLTYAGEANNYAVCADSDEARAIYAAIVRFFSARYSNIGGFVLGRAVNYSYYVGDMGDDTLKYARSLARLCNITYNTAASYHPDVTVIVPFGEPIDGVTDSNVKIEDDLLSVMLADSLEKNGGIPWTLMYCIDNAEDDISVADAIVDRLADANIARPYSVMYLYGPIFSETILDYLHKYGNDASGSDEYVHIEYSAELFTRLCDRINRDRVVFMEFDETPVKTSRHFYSALKAASESSGFIYESSAIPAGDTVDCALYSVWDFSDKYHTEGWLGGGGVASCLTGYSNIADYGSGRVLKTLLAGDGYGGAGVALGNLERTVDLSSVDSLRFTFAVTDTGGASAHANVSVVFVVGSNDYRAEYYAEQIDTNAMQSFVCDLSGYANRNVTDYIGVMIYAEEDICFELGTVEAVSNSIDGQSLAAVFEKNAPVAAENSENKSLILTVVVIAAAISAVVIILLVRRDREDRETAEKAKAVAESKNKRSYYEKYRQQK